MRCRRSGLLEVIYVGRLEIIFFTWGLWVDMIFATYIHGKNSERFEEKWIHWWRVVNLKHGHDDFQLLDPNPIVTRSTNSQRSSNTNELKVKYSHLVQILPEQTPYADLSICPTAAGLLSPAYLGPDWCGGRTDWSQIYQFANFTRTRSRYFCSSLNSFIFIHE